MCEGAGCRCLRHGIAPRIVEPSALRQEERVDLLAILVILVKCPEKHGVCNHLVCCDLPDPSVRTVFDVYELVENTNQVVVHFTIIIIAAVLHELPECHWDFLGALSFLGKLLQCHLRQPRNLRRAGSAFGIVFFLCSILCCLTYI